MPQLFVSYAHKDEAFTKKFIEVVQNRYKNDPAVRVWYDRNLTGGVDWWKEIMRQLGKTDIFIYLMSQTALNSEYCQAEFREAYRLRKQIITVQVDANLDIDNDQLSAIQYVDLTHGLDHADSRQELLRAIDDQLKRVPPMRLLPPRSWKQTSQPNQPNKSANAPIGTERVLRKPMDIDTRLAYIQTIIGAVGLIVSVIALVFAYIEISGSPTPTPPIIGGSVSAVPTPLPTTQPPPDGSLAPSPTVTLSVFEQVQTAEAIQTQQMQIQQTLNAQETATELTRLNTEKTVEAIGATETVAFATLLALSTTPTPKATLTALEQAIERARTFTGTRNVDWQPFSHVFNDGVARVLVPVGCFRMGSNDGDDDEQPVHEQCISEPFWLDKYEVTNALYGSASGCGYSSEADQPRNCVNWLDAQAFCEAHGGTLPSEKQWEYAARGVESWAYPWGNEYDVERVIGADDPTYMYNSTAPVGSRPDGVSWVGAMDMSGNLWEWTSTAYGVYPYTQEDEQLNNKDVSRILRGGSFGTPANGLRSAFRFSWNPADIDNYFGIRCAFSLNNSGL